MTRPGPDGKHPKILKELKDTIRLPLSKCFSHLNVNRTITRWLELCQCNCNIYKKGNKAIAGNYRLVNLTSIVCIIMESIARERVIEHLEKTNTISKNRFGFHSRRSTLLQLLKVLDLWTESLDKGSAVDMFYCDFVKAFETVSHACLIHEMKERTICNHKL